MNIIDKLLVDGKINYQDMLMLIDLDDIYIIVNNSHITRYDKNKHELKKARLIVINDDLYQLCNGFNNYTIRSKDYLKIRKSNKLLFPDQNQKVCITFNGVISSFERKPMTLQETRK